MVTTKWFNKFFYAVTIVAFMIKLIAPTPVYADDGVPPTDPAPVSDPADPTAPDAVDAPALDPAVLPDLPQGTDVVVLDENGAPLPLASEAAAEEVTPLLADVPPGTEVVVLDENGAPLPLASEAAAEVIAEGDPFWCPSTNLTPTSGGTGCSTNNGKLQTALTFASTQNVDGIIWIAAGAITGDRDKRIIIIAQSYGNTHSLTLNGGWTGDTTLDSATPSTFVTPININWSGLLTLKNITIAGVTENTSALYINSMSDVTLDHVIAQGNFAAGAELRSEDGTNKHTLTISESEFTGNGSEGVKISNFSDVAMDQVTATGNDGRGAAIIGRGGSGAVGTYAISDSIFSHNGTLGTYNGLEIKSTLSSVTLLSVTANNNTDNGAYIDLSDGTGSATVTDSVFGNLAVAGNDLTGGNGSAGLYINTARGSGGDITLSGVTADYNSSEGANLYANGVGKVQVADSQFTYNATGISVKSAEEITLNKVTASYNTADGADLTITDAANITSGITVENGSVFNYNNSDSGDGGLIVTANVLDLSNVTANNNNESGLVLANSAAGGKNTLDNITAQDNTGYGIDFGNLKSTYTCTHFTTGNDNYKDPEYVEIVCPFGPSDPGSGGGETPPSGGDDWEHEHPSPEDHGVGIKNVEVSGGQSVDLSCGSGIGGYNLGLGGNQVSLPCTSFGETQANSVVMSMKNDTEMPSAIDAQFTFLAGMEVTIVAPLSGSMTVSFAIPEGMAISNLSILFWNGSAWVEVGGYQTADGKFGVSGTNGGVYVLVKK